MRAMGEIVFLTPNEAEAVGRKLYDAGFEFKITDDVDDCSDDTRFMMIWRDYEEEDEDRAVAVFDATVNEVIAQPRNFVDCVGVVAPDHVPASFSDYGDPN
jgi:hypothetical protein